jgi:hypothetical protein
MSWLKSLRSTSRLLEVLQAFPETARPLIAYHEALLRGASRFGAGEREMVRQQLGQWTERLCFMRSACTNKRKTALGNAALDI